MTIDAHQKIRSDDQPRAVVDTGKPVVTNGRYVVIRAASSGHGAPSLWCDSFGCSICSGEGWL